MDSRPTRILFLFPAFQRELSLTSFLRRGAEIVIAARPDHGLMGFADRQVLLNSTAGPLGESEIREIEERVSAFHASYELSGIVVDYDFLLPLVGRLNERLGLAGHDEVVGGLCASKTAQRKTLTSAGVPSPSWRSVRTADDLENACAELGYPVVIKPDDRSASSGVVLVDRASSIEPSFKTAMTQAWNGQCVAEEFLDGPEFSVEAMCFGGELHVAAVASKQFGCLPNFVKLNAEVPADLDGKTEAAIAEVAGAAAAALGITDGPAHIELRVTADGPKVIEVNGRMGGFFLAEMVCAATGVNLYSAWYDVFRRQAPKITPSRRSVAVRRAITDASGKVLTVHANTSAITRAEQHVLTRALVSPGRVVGPLHSGADMPAVAIAVAPDRTTARAAADEFARGLSIECDREL